MKFKKLTSVLLAAAMILSLAPTAIAWDNATDAVTPTVSWAMETVGTRSSDDQTVYKLVGTINSPLGIKTIMTAIDYDNAVIQPVSSYEDETTKTMLYPDVTAENGDTSTFSPLYGHLKYTSGRSEQYYTEVVVWRSVESGRTSVEYTQEYQNATTSNNAGSTKYMEFYFRLADGKTTDNMNANTFKFHCQDTNDPIAFSVLDANNNKWTYYPDGGNTVGYATLTPSLTYTNSDVKVHSGVAEIDGVDVGTAAEVRAALESTATENITLYRDVDFGGTYASVPAGANITLNLNGHTITCSAVYTIYNNGTLTIDGGEGNQATSKIINTSTYSSNSTDYAALYNYTGTLTLKNLTVSNTGTNSAVCNYYNVNTSPYTFATLSAENCTMISEQRYGLSTTGTVTTLSGCTIQTNGNAYAMYVSGLGHNSSPYGVIGTIENTKILSTSASATKPAIYLVGSMNYLDWNTASDCTIGTMTGCTIETNSSAQAPAIYLTTGAMIYSLTDSTVSGGTNAVEIVRHWYNGGITHLSANMTAHNGDVINISGTGNSSQQQLVGIEGGAYKPSSDDYYIYNVEKGDNYFIWVNTSGKLQKDSEGYYHVGTTSDNENFVVTFYGSDGNMYKAVAPVKTGTTLASVLGSTTNPTKVDSKNILEYTFEGWTLTKGGTELVSADYQVTGNTDLYPVYSEKVVGDVAIKLTMRHPFTGEDDLAYVASLEGYYSSFGAAYQIYNSNTLYANYVLTLQKDVVAAASTSEENAAGIWYSSVWCSAEKELTIDLAGHTLTMNAPMNVCWPGTEWVDQIALTITDSVGGGKLVLSEDCTTASNGVIYAYQTARIKIDGNLTIENPNGPAIVVNSGKYYQSSSDYWQDESILTISGGAKLVGSTNGVEIVAGSLSNGHLIPVTVDGATITGQNGYAISTDDTSGDMAITLASGTLNGTSGALNVNTSKITWKNAAGKATALFTQADGSSAIKVGYTVTFKNGDTVVKTQAVEDGGTVNAPATDPTKDPVDSTIYVFQGWSETADGTDLVTFPVELSNDVTYYAVYQAKTQAKPDDSGNATVENLDVKDDTPITITTTTTEESSEKKTDVSVSIPGTIVQAIEEQNTKSLTVETDVADVTFDQDALKAIVKDSNAQSSGIKLETKKTDKDKLDTVKQNAIQNEDALIIDLSLTSGGSPVTFKGGKAEIKAPFTIPEGKSADDFAVFYISENGNRAKLSSYKFEGGYVTFTAEHFSTYAVDNSTGYTMSTQVSGGATTFNAGDTITVNIVASATEASAINSFQFTLSYDSKLLTLTKITNALTGGEMTASTEKGTAAYNVNGSTQTISTGETTIATAIFTVNTGITNGTAADIGLSFAEMTTANYLSSKAPTVTGTSVTLYNIKVTLNADANSTIDGINSLTLYAKYGKSGLYSDETRETSKTSVTAKANEGYRLANNNWITGKTEVKDFNEILTQTFTEDTTYTLQTVQQVTVKFQAGANGSLEGTTEVTVDKGAALPAQPTAKPNTGYTFAGWYEDVNSDAINTTDYTVDKSITLTAKFTANTYDYVENASHVTLSDLTGVTGGKATYGTPITFKAAATDNYVLNTVSYQIGTAASVILNADENGVYTVPGNVILGKVTILADITQYHTITFQSGENTTMKEVTAYVKDNAAGLYASLDALKTGTTGTFTVPTPKAKATYRLAKDTSSEPLWAASDGSNTYTSSALTSTSVFTSDVTLVAQAIKTYVVTFVAGAHGDLAKDAETTKTVDTKTSWSDVSKPEIVPDAGYVFDSWTLNPNATPITDTDTITSDITVTVNFKDGSYKVTLPDVNNVTISTSGTDTTSDGLMATHNKDVQVTVKVSEGAKVTKVTYQIGSGSVVTVKEDNNGIGTDETGYTFTINGADITGAINVNVTSNETYQITFTADDNGTVDGEKSVTKTFDKGHVLEESDLPATAGSTGYQFDKWTPTPAGQTVTGAVTYTATFKKGTYNVTLSEDVSGISATATYDSDLTFTPTASGKIIIGVTAKIGDTAIDVTGNDDGSYTIKGSQITGDITITLTSIKGTLEYITATNYLALENGTKVVIVKTDKLDGSKYTLDDKELYYSSKYSGYVTIVNDAKLTDAQIASKLSTSSGDAAVLSYDGDVNNSGSVTAADSGVINDMIHSSGALQYTPDVKQRLELDVNGDKTVSAKDIVWVLQKSVDTATGTTGTDGN
jgi:uncharacterized repeat protein (TIGR02543 family)